MKDDKSKLKKYYTTGDIASYCEVDVNTVKNWIRNGNLTAFKTPSGHYRVSREMFISFIHDQGFTFDSDYFGQVENGTDILIVDDDKNQIELFIYLLEQIYGKLRIETATNGFDGYVKVYHSRPKLVILDLKMTDISGLEFLKVVRTKEDMKYLKILVISAYLDNSTVKELKKLNVDAILPKPIKKPLLKEKCDLLFQEMAVS